MTTNRDPIFALIQRERAAWDLLESLSCVEDCQDDPAWQQADHEQTSTLNALCSASPTTAPGLSAMLDVYQARATAWICEPQRSQLAGICKAAKAVVQAQQEA